MSNIFEESNMLWVLKNYIPDGENFSAGVHGITLQVNKKKTSRFDVYVGITENYLIVVECEERTYLNDRYNIKDKRSTVAEDIGTCFLFEDIQSCEIKKGFMGAVNCSMKFKDGDFLKHLQR